jgi:glycosyltransferase involved in cell wall biosynthesis
MRDAGHFESVLVTRVGPPQTIDEPRSGTRFALADDDPSSYYLYTSQDEFDRFLWSARDKRLYTDDWREFLYSIDPDVVHFQHSLWLGYDMLRETRAVLPRGAIVYTLHEFLPICHNDGQMIRTLGNELCDKASPRRCNQCFPEISPQDFLLRERFIRTAFEAVDMFIAPSDFARRRYLSWGIPPARIQHENYGRVPVERLPEASDAGRRKRIGYIGRITPHKGVDVLLEAMKYLDRSDAGVQLMVCGNLLGPREFLSKMHELLSETAGCVQFVGRYEQPQLPSLLSSVDWLIVPSLWWETGPLSIHEARQHRVPVICSDIGSLAERIEDGVNGLHFHVGDPYGLAEVIRRATSSPELWDEIRSRMTEPHAMADHLEVMTALYERLLLSKRAAIASHEH